MTIICGTDFSEAAEAACRVAAELAAHHGEPLLIAHALALLPMAPPAEVPLAASVYDDLVASAKKSADELVRKLAGTRAEIVTSVEVGEPDEVLLRLAAREKARLMVIASVGRRGGRWLLGSTADRLASRSPFPLLVTRPGFPAHEWLGERKPIRVIVASDLGPATDPAVEWAAHLPEHGPCRYVVAHLSWPPAEYDRLAIDAAMHLDRTHPVVEELLRDDLSAAAQSLRGEGETKVVVESTMGRTADALMYVAGREEADLLVVGRSLDDERQWWETSTSRAIVRKAPMSVVVVPHVEDEPEIAAPRIRRVLAATDLSRRGNAAVAYALALTPADSSVRIIHVLDSDDPEETQQCQRAIDELVRSVAPGNVAVEIEIIRGGNPARRISGEAERCDADLICIGTRGRYGISRVLFGSVSQEVQLRSDRPVLLVQEPPRQKRT